MNNNDNSKNNIDDINNSRNQSLGTGTVNSYLVHTGVKYSGRGEPRGLRGPRDPQVHEFESWSEGRLGIHSG